MAHPKFKDTCRYCKQGGLRWREQKGRWVLMERDDRIGRVFPHKCNQVPWENRGYGKTNPYAKPALRTEPVPGVEYVTAREQREIVDAQFFEHMDHIGDPYLVIEYLECGWPLEPIASTETTEDSTPQWIV